MQTSNGETKGLEVTIGEGQPDWEKGLAKMPVTHRCMPPTGRRVVVAAKRKTRACGRVGVLMPEMFPPVGRFEPRQFQMWGRRPEIMSPKKIFPQLRWFDGGKGFQR